MARGAGPLRLSATVPARGRRLWTETINGESIRARSDQKKKKRKKLSCRVRPTPMSVKGVSQLAALHPGHQPNAVVCARPVPANKTQSAYCVFAMCLTDVPDNRVRLESRRGTKTKSQYEAALPLHRGGQNVVSFQASDLIRIRKTGFEQRIGHLHRLGNRPELRLSRVRITLRRNRLQSDRTVAARALVWTPCRIIRGRSGRDSRESMRKWGCEGLFHRHEPCASPALCARMRGGIIVETVVNGAHRDGRSTRTLRIAPWADTR